MPFRNWIAVLGCVVLLGHVLAGTAAAQATNEGQVRQVKGFTSVALVGTGTVKVKQTGREQVTIKGDARTVQVEVRNGVLRLDGLPGLGGAEVIVEAKTLDGLILTGQGKMEAESVNTKRLAVTLTGNGDLKVSGTAETLDLTVSGMGNFQGDSLKTEQVTVAHSGMGKAVVNVSKRLNVTVTGIGSVEYIGKPKVQDVILGLGKVIKRP